MRGVGVPAGVFAAVLAAAGRHHRLVLVAGVPPPLAVEAGRHFGRSCRLVRLVETP